MPEKDGVAFIFEIMQEFPGTKVFAITGKNTMMGFETELDIAKELGALKGFIKPVKLSELLAAIKELQYRDRTMDEGGLSESDFIEQEHGNYGYHSTIMTHEFLKDSIL